MKNGYEGIQDDPDDSLNRFYDLLASAVIEIYQSGSYKQHPAYWMPDIEIHPLKHPDSEAP